MASFNTEIKISVSEYRIVFFPFATFVKYGEVEIFRIFGIPVYRKVGDIKKYL